MVGDEECDKEAQADDLDLDELGEFLVQGEPLSRFELLWLIAENARERGDRTVAVKALRMALAEIGAEDGMVQAQEARAMQPPTDPTNRRIDMLLVIDDDHELRSAIERQLEPKYNVLLTDQGEVALATAVSEQPDLILLDISFPELKGAQTLRLLRREPDTQEIPIILLTDVLASYRDLVPDRSINVLGVLEKPLDVSLIEERLNGLIHQTG
jgi:CheY-like chemotaxis protein